MPGARAGGRIVYVKNMKSGITTASLVVVPPIIGSIAYFAPLGDGLGCFLLSYLYVASASLSWWPLSRFLKKRTFIAGLLGLHAMMAYFLFAMSRHWGDDLSWIFYLPNVLVGLVVGILISLIAAKANDWIHRTPR
jgi:predicted membrane-bound spermidine synthase